MTVENVEAVPETVNEVLCEIVKEGNDYFLIDLESNEKVGPIKISNDGIYLMLPKNRANRHWVTIEGIDKIFAKGDRYLMTYKASKKFGSVVEQMLRNKLFNYLSDEDRAEITAIINRANEAREAAKAQPLSDIEKTQRRLEKLKAKLAALEAEAE